MNPEKRQYTLSKQETHYYCMPAVVQAILRRYGREEEQAAIAHEIKCTPERGAGFDSDLGVFLKKRNFGFQFFWYNEVMFKEPELLVEEALERDNDLFIGCPNGNSRGHVRLALDYSSPNLLVLDPKDAGSFFVNLEELYSRMWEQKFGGFGLIEKLAVTKPAQQT